MTFLEFEESSGISRNEIPDLSSVKSLVERNSEIRVTGRKGPTRGICFSLAELRGRGSENCRVYCMAVGPKSVR